MKEKISIIIPAYNEAKRIGRTLEAYGKFLRDKKANFEAIVVLNACTDNTLDIVKQWQEKFEEIRYLEFEQGGKGFAIIKGFKEALKNNSDLIGFVDADMATLPQHFYELVDKIGNYDGIIAARWKKDSVIKEKKSIIRKIYSFGFNFLVRSLLFLPHSDTQCGAKLFKKKAIENVINDIGITRWAFDIDLLYKLNKKGFKVKEIPTIWEDKAGSTIGVKAAFQMFFALIRLRLLNSRFKFVVRAYDKMPEWTKLHHRIK